MTTSHRNTSGFSLVELMIALAIGTFLMLGLVEVFAASRAAYALSEGLSRVQENSRFAMEYLQRDLRMAGHMGCVNDLARLPADDPDADQVYSTLFTGADATTLAFDAQIVGYEATGSAPGNTLNPAPVSGWIGAGVGGGLPTAINNATPNKVLGSDILVLRFFGPEAAPLTSLTIGPNSDLDLTAANLARLTTGASNPGLFALAGCDNAVVFQANTRSSTQLKVQTAGINVINLQDAQSAGLTPNETLSPVLYRAEMVVYYVGLPEDASRVPEPGLYRARFNVAPGTDAITVTRDELVEGIESLQLLYGQGADEVIGDLTQYNVATAMTGGNARGAARLTRAVQVGILARSPTPSTARGANSAVQNPTVAGVIMDAPNDGRFRAAYHSTVALRNHVTVRH